MNGAQPSLKLETSPHVPEPPNVAQLDVACSFERTLEEVLQKGFSLPTLWGSPTSVFKSQPRAKRRCLIRATHPGVREWGWRLPIGNLCVK